MTLSPASLPESRNSILLAAILVVLIILISGGMTIYVFSDNNLKNAFLIARAALQVEQSYPLEVDYDRLFESAMDGMIGQLDRFSGYVEPSRWERMNESFDGSYTGIGIIVTRHDLGLLVISIREDGSAAKEGMLNGDIIIRADSTELAGLTASGATDLIRGKEGTNVLISVLRTLDDDTLTFDIPRKRIDFQHVPFAGLTPDSAIYIRLLDFDAGASRDVKKVIDSLIALNPSALGLMLDLRGNPGGLLQEAYKTADLFLEMDKLIVGTKGRSIWKREEFYSTGKDITSGLPMVILVDRGSASASEIVAGALLQNNRAVLVGDTTFGKGLVQGFTRYLDGSALRLTISRYYLKGGIYLNEFDSTLNDIGHGLPPDYYISFIERDPFPRALEYSQFLNSFANENKDEIIKVSDQFNLDDSWVERFIKFAKSEGFSFTSELTQSARTLSDLAMIESSHQATIEVSSRIVLKAEEIDNNYFQRYSDYIKMRLKQIALERRFGVKASYEKAIITDREDIAFATQLLREMKQ